MNLNKFYTISFNDYGNVIKFRFLDMSLLERLHDCHNDISFRIYDNKKLLYRFHVYHNKITSVKKSDGDYVKFNLTNIKKELLQDSLKLLDSNDSLNHALFLEIFKIKLNEIT
jgi:hypothetical protein